MNYYQQEIVRIQENHFPQQHQIERVVLAKNFMDSAITEMITLDDIASSARISKFHFMRLFKRCYGRTPHQYLIEIKMARAKQLLCSGITVSATCFTLGYNSPTTFSGLFKKITGYTPAQYRQKKQF